MAKAVSKAKKRMTQQPNPGAQVRAAGQQQRATQTQQTKSKKKLGKVDLPLLALTMLLLLFGLVMLFSASYPYSLLWHGNSYMFIRPQVQYAVIGIVCMGLASVVDYHLLRKFAWPLMLVSILLLIVVLFMPAKNDANRWIWLNGAQTRGFQPSEIVKFAVILLFAAIIAANQSRIKTFKYGFLPFVLVLGVVGVLLLLEPHLSCTILVLGIGIAMMFTGGTSVRWFGIAAAIFIVGLYVLITSFPQLLPYVAPRIQVWLDPFNADPKKNHQVVQSIIAVGSGGLTGRGIGKSVQKFLYLPEMYNDYIFAVLCEELGFVGAISVIVLFLLLLGRGLYVAVRAKDKFGSMLAVGICVQIALQAFVHIAVNVNAIPSTGISMPFFSSGGSSLVMLLGQMGILLSVSRQANTGRNVQMPPEEDAPQEPPPLPKEAPQTATVKPRNRPPNHAW